MEAIPTAVCLTSYAGGPDEFMNTPLEELAKQARVCAAGSLSADWTDSRFGVRLPFARALPR